MAATPDAPAASSVGLLALQLGLFVAVGLPDGALGVAWPGMRGSFHRPTADLGLLIAAGTAGYVIGGSASGGLVQRIGAGRLAWAAATLSAVALAGQAGAPGWPLLLAAALLLGAARGSTDATLNAYVANHGGVRQLGLLHAAYGVGTTVAPLIATALLATGWRWGWAVLACATGGLAVWAWTLHRRWPGDHVEVEHPVRRASWSAAFVLTLVTFGVYVGAEFGTASWAFVLLTEHRGMAQGQAGVIVAGFWAALTAGRLVLWRAGERVSRTTLLHVSCATAMAGLGWLWLNPAHGGWIGIPVAGLGMAAIFPTLIALTPDRLGADRAAAAIGWSVAASSIGAAGLSALAGVLPLAPTLAAYGVALMACHLALAAVAPPEVRTAVSSPGA